MCGGDLCGLPHTSVLSRLCALGKRLTLVFHVAEFCTISVLLFTGSYMDVNYADAFPASDDGPFSMLLPLISSCCPSSSSVVC